MSLFRFFLTCGRGDAITYTVCHNGRVEIESRSWSELMSEINHSPHRDSAVFKWQVTCTAMIGGVRVIAYV